MSKKLKYYEIKSKDDEKSVYGSFHISDLKRMANALISDIEQEEKKDKARKEKNSLLKRLRKLIDD